ncbi:unnamed protein product, partial [Meganyctiphanes norvegica]
MDPPHMWPEGLKREWGELDNGSWIGMLGDVFRGKKDLAINYFTVTHERAQYFDHSVSYTQDGFGFAIAIPPPLPRWQSVINPFSYHVWLGTGLVVVFAILAQLIITLGQKDHHTTIFKSAAYVTMVLVNQGVP